MPSDAVIKAINIYKSFKNPYPVEILNGVSLEIYSGESIAIMGASGEGKSTLLNIFGTLEVPSSGELWIKGKTAKEVPSALLRNLHIGFIFQAFNLLEDYTVLQNVLMPALISGSDVRKGSHAYERGFSLIEKVGLSHRAHFAAKMLSGGEKQRVAIARALCNDPEVILADEPSGNLDHGTSQRIHELLLGCVCHWNKALIVVTHDNELAALCNKTFYLRDGKLSSTLNLL
jgi:lipoprotein-releasing system ATP-binding protein